MLRNMAVLILTVFFAAVVSPSKSHAGELQWSGTLVDAGCTHANGGSQACSPGLNTTSFGLVVAGKAYIFNMAGSQKASLAMKQRAAMHAVDPHYPYATPVTATVTGDRAGNELIVKRIVIE
jgi:hypothetical protein